MAWPRRGPGLWVLTRQMRWEGDRALSAWLDRACLASEALPPPERPVTRRCLAVPRVHGKRPPPR